jgi:hypothetical protein
MDVCEDPAMPQNGWSAILFRKNVVTSPVGHFTKMAKVTLIHPQQRVEVSGRALVHKSDLFADNLTLLNSPYTVQSPVPLRVFQDFVAALEDEAVPITNDNLSGLSRLCDEFRFRGLGTRLSQFRDSGAFHEQTMRLSVAETGAAPAEMSQVQESAVEALLGRAARLEAKVSETGTASALTQLRNDLKKLKGSMEPLHEDVRALIEWAQTSTSHST